ncbi:MAG: phosphodiester glycosidase family protein [Muribaculaceae bacterium]|nr:phosphodiester glycosidase family protein [Muribaculaceae bacterium]
MIKKILRSAFAAALLLPVAAQAESIEVSGKTYELTRLIERDLGPGVHYTRVRLPEYPLNVNIITMDMDNPYNTIETTIANETQFGTEYLVNAAARQTREGHKVLGGANANFFVTSSFAPYGPLLNGVHVVGCVRNGQIVDETNMNSDQWNGGYTETGIFFVDSDRNLHCEAWPWFGKIKTDNIGNIDIYQVNKICRDNEVCLYTGYYDKNMSFMPADLSSDGRTFNIVSGVSTEVYLKFAKNQTWATGKNMTFTVEEIVTGSGPGKRGDYDAVLVARGDKGTKLAGLQKGESIKIKLGWSSEKGGKGTVPVIDNLVGGNALVMKDGELTSQNYNPDNMGNYNPMTYSRCSYGSSADGRKLFICVIDMATDPVYGASKGINTEGLCHIVKHFGCSNLVSMDAGGSAQMLVGDRIINKTTESTPRAVANGMLVYSTAPADNEVTRLEFYDYELEAPVYGTYAPRIIAYNRYGDIINDDYRDFTLSCDPSVGNCDGTMFTAAGSPAEGELTATSGTVTVRKQMKVMGAQIALRLKNILIDNTREYPMEVNATVGQHTYTYDHTTLAWESDNQEVATVENGVLRGVAEGTAKVRCTVGEFSDECDVTVEIAPEAVSEGGSDGWKASGTTGVTAVSMGGDGTIQFTYGSPRTPFVKIAKTIKFYSLPDRLLLTFTPSVDVSGINVDLRTPQHSRTNRVDITPAEGDLFAAGKTHTVEIPMPGKEDIGSFPYILYYIQFNIAANTSYKGSQTIRLDGLRAEYDNNMQGVESVSDNGFGDITIEPAVPGAGDLLTVTSGESLKAVTLHDLGGRTVAHAYASGKSAQMVVPDSANGVYLLTVESKNSVKSKKIIIK